MKKGILSLAAVAVCGLFTAVNPALAQNTVVTYQGWVTDNGTNFTGIGQFQFALVYSDEKVATAVANPPVNGQITGYTLTSPGFGYLTAPTVTVVGGGGSGATATVSFSLDTVVYIIVNNPGNGYTSTPTVTISPPAASTTYPTFWSNDGTSDNGSEPTASVSVNVTNGLFTVGLGDTTLANMGVLPQALFQDPDLYLRIWFNDGVAGFAALNPPEPLTSAPYASLAYAANSLAGTLPASQISGMLPAAQISGTLPASQISGTLPASQISGMLPASQISGMLPASQISGTLPVSQISGTIPLAQLPSTLVTNNEAGVNLNGSFTGNASALTNIQLSAVVQAGFTTVADFESPLTFYLYATPVCVVAVPNVDGHGNMALVSADYYTGTLSVFTNNGGDGFSGAGVLNVGVHPSWVTAVSNVDGQGHMALVSANFFDDTLTVLTNNGSGVFGSNATYTVGTFPDYVTAVPNVDGSGHLALVSANYSPNTLTVLTNNGSGVFGSNATLNVGSTPYCVAVVPNVDGLGHLALVSANSGSGTLTVLTNNGSGVFGFNATLTVGNTPEFVVAVPNIDGQGHMALVSANFYGNTLTVLTNNGSGVFGFNATLDVGSEPDCVTVATNVDGQGRLALISANENDNTLTVLTNNGSGVFGLNTTLNVGSDCEPDCVVAVPNVDGHGHLALVSANNNYAGNNEPDTLTLFLDVPEFSVGGFFNGTFTGNSSGTFTGNGSGLTSLTAGNLTGTVPASSLTSVPAGSLTGTLPTSVFPTPLNLTLSLTGGLDLDDSGTYGQNTGTVATNALTFGTGPLGSGEGIASKRIGTDPFDLEFFTGFKERMAILADGYVGVGTASPQQTLQVGDASVSGSQGMIRLESRSNNGSPTRSWDIGVPQTGNNTAGMGYSFAIIDDGAGTSAQLLVQYGTGNVGIANTNPTHLLVVGAGAYCDGNTWVPNSDRNLKSGFAPLDTSAVLAKVAALPITRWHYNNDATTPHVGPMAQDFYSAFAVGADNRHISDVDEGGVALAAIQGLNQKLEAKDAEIQDLKARLEKLEQLMGARNETGK